MKDIRLLSSFSLLGWLEFLSRTVTNAFSEAFLLPPPRDKGTNILNILR